MMWSIFSHNCWPLVCHLWKSAHSDFLLTFKLIFFLFWLFMLLNCMSSLFLILNRYQIYGLQHILKIISIVILFCWFVFVCLFSDQKRCTLIWSHLFIFAFVSCAVGVISKLPRAMSRSFSPIFFQEFYGFKS